MSLNNLAEEALRASRQDPVLTANDSGTPKPPSRDDVLTALTKYIPTETITLYIAAVATQGAITSVLNEVLKPENEILLPVVSKALYYSCIALTPILFLILFFRKRRIAGEKGQVSFDKWPWWKMFAATIAFTVWALAVPENGVWPDGETFKAVAAFGAFLVSMFLNILTPFFEPKPKEPVVS